MAKARNALAVSALLETKSATNDGGPRIFLPSPAEAFNLQQGDQFSFFREMTSVNLAPKTDK
jgi:hypothetical protein